MHSCDEVAERSLTNVAVKQRDVRRCHRRKATVKETVAFSRFLSYF
jgi:hypothetical protein